MPKQTLLFRALALVALAALPLQAQDVQPPTVNSQPPRRVPPGRNLNRPTQRNAQEAQKLNSRGTGARPLPPGEQQDSGGSSFNASRVRSPPAQTAVGQQPNAPTAMTQPPALPPVDHNDVRKNARTVILSFDKRDLTELIQFVSQELGRNFILPERVGGKVTLLSNAPVPIDEVWNVFVAALDANNWSVYPVGHYWKLVEKKQSPRTNIPTMLAPGEEAASTEQMVTKLFKLKYVEAEQMRNVLNFFISKDADLQIFPPDTLIISDLGLNMRRLDHLIEQLDVPGGSEEIHIVSVQYAAAQELAQKLTEIFQAQQNGPKSGGPRQIGVAEPVQPVQPGQLGGVFAQNQASSGGPVQVSKIIAEERTNKLIVIAGGKSFARVAELIKQLDVPSSEGGVHVYYLENAKAEDVAATMQSLAQGLSSSSGSRGRVPGAGATAPVPSPGGASSSPSSAELFSGQVKITADKNTNSLVVIASQADYRNLVKVVERLDIRRRQVFVEAVIMEVNLENDTDFGVSAH
ncbi:MAG TPA: secretin N-terminal domain-containing protein, partial [Myxococcales bacterium]